MKVEEYRVDIVVVLIALLCTVLSLIISFLFPVLQILVLTILTLMLPAIYQIGHIFGRECVRAKNEYDFSELQFVMGNLRGENKRLKKELEEYGGIFKEDYFDKA